PTSIRPHSGVNLMYSPASNGLAEGFVHTFKRDYVNVYELRDAESVVAQLGRWTDYSKPPPRACSVSSAAAPPTPPPSRGLRRPACTPGRTTGRAPNLRPHLSRTLPS